MNFSVSHNIDEVSLSDVDMDAVERRTTKRMAEEMVEYVTDAIRMEDDITSPAMNGPNTRGPGPSLIQEMSWKVQPTGQGDYLVRPIDAVRQRAVVLNDGYPGRIYPTSAEALKFTFEGETVYADSVEGPDETGYWDAAYRRLKKSGRPLEIAKEELEREVEEET